jgi:hypothetical protein
MAKHRAREREVLAKSWRPAGWEKWPAEQQAVGAIIIGNPGLKPRALGLFLDNSRLTCIWQQNGGSWERNFATAGTARNWLDRLTQRLEGNPFLVLTK